MVNNFQFPFLKGTSKAELAQPESIEDAVRRNIETYQNAPKRDENFPVDMYSNLEQSLSDSQFPQQEDEDFLGKLLSIPGFDPNKKPEELKTSPQDVQDYLFGNYEIPYAKPTSYLGDVKAPEAQQIQEPVVEEPKEDPKMALLREQIKMLQKSSGPSKARTDGESELRRIQLETQRNLGSSQEAENKNRLLAGMLRAGMMTGGAISGAKQDYAGVEGLEKTAGEPVKATQESQKSLLDFQKLIQQEKLQEEGIAARKDQAKYLADMKKLQFGEKEDQFATNKALAFQKTYREDLASGRSGAGIAQRKLQLAQDLKALIPKSDKEMDNLPNEMLKEITLSFTAMLSPSGVPAVRIVESMTPNTMKTYIGKNMSKITGDPEPANSHEYVKMFDKALDRQIDVNAEQLSLQKMKAISPVLQDPLLNTHPIIKSLASQEGFTDKDIEDARTGEFSIKKFAEKVKNENKQLSNVSAGGMVKIRLPNGKEGRISAEKLEEAKKLGAVEI